LYAAAAAGDAPDDLFFLCCFSLSGVRIALYRFPCLSAMLYIDQAARKKDKEKRSSSTTIHIIIHSIGVMNKSEKQTTTLARNTQNSRNENPTSIKITNPRYYEAKTRSPLLLYE
jgi:hypothetical protein